MISKEEADKMIRTRKHLYDACKANGYYLPESHRDPICTMAFLTEIFRGTVGCPKTDAIQFRNPIHTPTAKEMITLVTKKIDDCQGYANIDEANRWYRLAKYIRKSRPERAWLVGLLCCIDLENEIFKKGY